MRILVTGGLGFIGSHLSRRLLNMGHEVIALDNLYTGSEKNVEDLITTKNFEILHHDVTLPIFIEVDAIFNLACPASPVHYQKNPVQTIRTNVLGAINMLDLAKQLQVPILQASTSEVYGDPKESPQKESYLGNVNPIGIRACYDEGKRVAETLFFDYMRQYNLQIKVARIFNTYGPGMQFNDGRVVSNFIVQALKNENITIYGDGSQTRSFCFVTDLVAGLIPFLLSDKAITGPINLGNPIETPILNLAENIIEYTNSKSRIIQLSLPLGVQSIIGFVLSGTFSTSLMVLISLVITGVLSAGLLQIQQHEQVKETNIM
jgi:UDP-glucuronate decarboxylase